MSLTAKDAKQITILVWTRNSLSLLYKSVCCSKMNGTARVHVFELEFLENISKIVFKNSLFASVASYSNFEMFILAFLFLFKGTVTIFTPKSEMEFFLVLFRHIFFSNKDIFNSFCETLFVGFLTLSL